MKTLKRASKKLGLAVIVFAAAGYLVGSTLAQQDNATELYLVTNESAVAAGDTVTVDIRLKATEQNVNALQANLTYSTDQLEFTNIDTRDSAFEIEAEHSSDMGYITLARGNIKGVRGDVLVGTLTFRAMGEAHSNGKPEISFADGTLVLSEASNQDILTSAKPTTVNIRAKQ